MTGGFLLGLIPVTMTIRRYPAGALEGYTDTSLDAPDEITVPGCLFHMVSSASPLAGDDRYAVVDTWELIVPPGVVVLTDDVLVDPAGYEYAVLGRPQKLEDLSLGVDHGSLIAARRVGA